MSAFEETVGPGAGGPLVPIQLQEKGWLCAGGYHLSFSSLITKRHPKDSLSVPVSTPGDSLMDSHMVPRPQYGMATAPASSQESSAEQSAHGN